MEQYRVTGMTCAACSARVQKAVSSVDGVESCAVNLLTNSMNVEGTADAEAVISAVEKAGYGASLKNGKGERTSSEKSVSADGEMPILKKRLLFSLVFLIFLMYISMGHVMWGFPLPGVLAENPIAIGILQMLLTGIVINVLEEIVLVALCMSHLTKNLTVAADDSLDSIV